MSKSVILLQEERVHDDLDMFSHNGKPLMVAPFTISVYDSIVPKDILEKRIGMALSNRGKTLYYVNWTFKNVIYREFTG